MGRPPVTPAEQETRIVLSVLAGEMTISETARREKVSEQSIGRWKADFLEVAKTALVTGRSVHDRLSSPCATDDIRAGHTVWHQQPAAKLRGDHPPTVQVVAVKT